MKTVRSVYLTLLSDTLTYCSFLNNSHQSEIIRLPVIPSCKLYSYEMKFGLNLACMIMVTFQNLAYNGSIN